MVSKVFGSSSNLNMMLQKLNDDRNNNTSILNNPRGVSLSQFLSGNSGGSGTIPQFHVTGAAAGAGDLSVTKNNNNLSSLTTSGASFASCKLTGSCPLLNSCNAHGHTLTFIRKFSLKTNLRFKVFGRF